jgi:hypothetical protein
MAFFGLAIGLGCSTPARPPIAADDGPVRERFGMLQAAVKDGNAERIWPLLDARSQADAERIAREMQTAHSEANAEEKKLLEDALGFTPAQFSDLTGKTYLTSKRFREKYHELPESKIESVDMQADHATVHFLEPDGDKEKAIFVRQDGEWKAWLKIPRPAKR